MKNYKGPNKLNSTSPAKTNIQLLDLTREYNELAADLEKVMLQTASSSMYIMGPAVRQFENEILEYLGSKYCCGVASGTDALVLSLRALAIKTKGNEYFSSADEIITSPFTFTATGGSILRAGATPVFVDIDPNTFNIDPQKIEEAITPNTVGIIPVHLYGRPCPMDDINNLAKAHNLFVLEDVAQAFGATYKHQKLGTIGDLGAFSFFPSKNLHRHGGIDKYNVEHIGYNSRLDTIQAAILLIKLKHIDRFNKMRRRIAACYDNQMQNISWLILPSADDQGHVYHQYTVRVKNGNRDLIQQQLQQYGIATAVYYPVPLHRMKVFEGRCRIASDMSQAELSCLEVLSLPIGPFLYEEEIECIADSIKAIKT
jgi:dTDP-4-amino-4,6-dideoxygalactose transaminase